jgi:Concanavalin A-like lectin/glucanases superfamily
VSTRDSLTNAHPSYTASSPPSPAAGITVMAWVWISVDNNAFSTICRLHSSTGGATCVVLGMTADGTTPAVFSASGTVSGTSCTVGTWYHIAYTLTGTAAILYQSLGTAAAAVTSGTVTPGVAPTGLTWFGRSSGDTSETFNGRIQFGRMWSTVLTGTEIAAEKVSTTVVKTGATFFAHWPMTVSTSLTDVINGHNLVANTGALTTEADVPLGHVTALGSATETDTASALVRKKSLALGRATEADTGSAPTRKKTATLARATESDTVSALVRSKALTMPRAGETDTGRALIRARLAALGRAPETDTAAAIIRRKTIALGRAVETDTAAAVQHGTAIVLGRAVETSSVVTLVRSRALAVGRAVEVDSCSLGTGTVVVALEPWLTIRGNETTLTVADNLATATIDTGGTA